MIQHGSHGTAQSKHSACRVPQKRLSLEKMEIDLPPSHMLAKLDHSRRKALAVLRKILHSAPGHIVFSRNNMHRHLVTEISQLQSHVEATIHAGQLFLLICDLSKLTALYPIVYILGQLQ